MKIDVLSSIDLSSYSDVLASCVPLGELLNLSVLQVPSLK